MMDYTSTFSLGSDFTGSSGDAVAGLVSGGFGLLMLCLVCVGLLIFIAQEVWIYNDAKKKNNPNVFLWLILGFLLNFPLGLIIYFLFGRNQVAAPSAPVTSQS